MSNTIIINGQSVTVPSGMSVNFVNGGIQIVPVQTHKTVHLDKLGQKIDTKATKAKTPKTPKEQKPVDPKSKEYYSKENLAAIKSFFVSKNGITTEEDVNNLAEQLKVPAGVIGSQFYKKSLAVCYGSITLPNVNAFLANAAANNYRVASLYNDPKIVAMRNEKLAMSVKA